MAPAHDRKQTGGRSSDTSDKLDHLWRRRIERKDSVFALRVLLVVAVAFALMATALVVSLFVSWLPGE